MPELLVQQWGALLQKMEVETSRYLNRYHYFFGYSGAALAFAMTVVGTPLVPQYFEGNEYSSLSAGIGVLAGLVSVGTAVMAKIMIDQYIKTRGRWRGALRLIEGAVANGPTQPITLARGGGKMFFPAYTDRDAWQPDQELGVTELSMRIAGWAWLAIAGAAFIGLVSHLVCCIAGCCDR